MFSLDQPSQTLGIKTIGLAPLTHPAGIVLHRPRIKDEYDHSSDMRELGQAPVISPRRLHGNQRPRWYVLEPSRDRGIPVRQAAHAGLALDRDVQMQAPPVDADMDGDFFC
jgi:hypothetical protein